MYTFTATYHKDQTDKDGESKIIFTAPMTEVDTIAEIKKACAGQQQLLKITIELTQ